MSEFRSNWVTAASTTMCNRPALVNSTPLVQGNLREHPLRKNVRPLLARRVVTAQSAESYLTGASPPLSRSSSFEKPERSEVGTLPEIVSVATRAGRRRTLYHRKRAAKQKGGESPLAC